jgi:WD40 repeat protein
MASTSSQVQTINNSCVECHDGRDSGRPFHWTHRFGPVCGILARWPAHRLRFRRSNNSCVECHDGRDSGRPFHWTHNGGHWVIRSVAFSPDGQHIVSGSDDGTIRVWNAMTGETAAGPFTGHTHSVNSVAFSPDGQYIVSGSDDHTIRMWNAMVGETAAGPFAEHRALVNSMAFSPDGQHTVSVSFDRTIRVSNVTIGKTETTNDVDFTDHFMINDEGWICGSKGELLMWIPSVHREYFTVPYYLDFRQT